MYVGSHIETAAGFDNIQPLWHSVLVIMFPKMTGQLWGLDCYVRNFKSF